MKPIIITLMYLTFGGDIKLINFEIHQSCDSWWHTNIVQQEKKKKTFMTNHYYHTYKDKKVIGYICGGQEPR
jgi:hypothetical protein